MPDLDQTLSFSALEWGLIGGGVLLMIVAVCFIATVWHVAYHAGGWFARENRRHRATEDRAD